MKIKELHLKNFGKFSDKTIVFQDGINLFYGENESGKTTIHTFIKSMLFGMERGRGRASGKDSFSLYEPWENPNYYSGVLKFESGGKKFSLTRNFDKYGKSADLICEDDGEKFSLEHGDLEMLLNGLTASNYENTVAIGQMKVETSQSLATALQNYATNYYATGNSTIDLEGALTKLRNQKKEAEKELRLLEEDRRKKSEEIEQKQNYIHAEMRAIEQELRTLEEQIVEGQKSFREVQAQKKQKQVFFGGGILLVCGILFFAFDISPMIIAAVLAFAGLAFWIKRKTLADGVLQAPTELSKLLWQQEHLQEEKKDKAIIYENLQEELSEFCGENDESKNLKKTIKSLELATEKMLQLSKDVHEEISVRLNDKASSILKEITDGKYEMLFIDEKLQMSLYASGRRISLEQVSRGTIEQIYFSLRMAASEILYDEEYPIILDDTFVYYDDKRLENTLRWLEKHKKQVLLFTCQKREGEILNRI